MKEFLRKRKLNIICSVVAIAIVAIVWVVAYFIVDNEYVLPSLWQSLAQIVTLFSSAFFWQSFFATFTRTLLAFLISFVLAVIFIVLGTVSRPFKMVFATLISFLRTLPTLAITLMLLMWSTPKVAPVIVVILVLFPTMYAQLDAAITGIDSGLIEMANIYKVSKKDKISKIYLPQIAPNTFSQAGANFSLGIKVMISAEVLSYTYRSIGGMMQQSKLYAEMPRFAALVIICIVVGLIVEVALSKLTLLTNKWNRKGVAYEN